MTDIDSFSRMEIHRLHRIHVHTTHKNLTSLIYTVKLAGISSYPRRRLVYHFKEKMRTTTAAMTPTMNKILVAVAVLCSFLGSSPAARSMLRALLATTLAEISRAGVAGRGSPWQRKRHEQSLERQSESSLQYAPSANRASQIGGDHPSHRPDSQSELMLH